MGLAEIFSFVSEITWLSGILFVAGLSLVIFEIFYPGFGAAGITGIILLFVGILLTANSFQDALIMALIIIVLLAVALVFVVRSATKGRLSKKLVLSDSLKKESGFTSTEDLNFLIGRKGKAITMLRPSGSADFDGIRLDVVSEGEFIPKDEKVSVIKVEGRRIVVKKADD